MSEPTSPFEAAGERVDQLEVLQNEHYFEVDARLVELENAVVDLQDRIKALEALVLTGTGPAPTLKS